MPETLSPCCFKPATFVKEKHNLDGTEYHITYKCTACDHEYTVDASDPNQSIEIGKTRLVAFTVGVEVPFIPSGTDEQYANEVIEKLQEGLDDIDYSVVVWP